MSCIIIPGPRWAPPWPPKKKLTALAKPALQPVDTPPRPSTNQSADDDLAVGSVRERFDGLAASRRRVGAQQEVVSRVPHAQRAILAARDKLGQ